MLDDSACSTLHIVDFNQQVFGLYVSFEQGIRNVSLYTYVILLPCG